MNLFLSQNHIMPFCKENFMLNNICNRIYSWFLSSIFAIECIADFCPFLGLLTFKEWVTWPWFKRWVCFSCKTYRTWHHWKENFILINNCNRTHNWFYLVIDLQKMGHVTMMQKVNLFLSQNLSNLIQLGKKVLCRLTFS